MSEKQSDIFDEPFKNAAEQYEPAFSEAAWEKMQAKLDKEDRRRKPAGWIWWLSDGLMLALMLYIAATFNNDRYITDSESKVATPSSQKSSSEKNNTNEPKTTSAQGDTNTSTGKSESGGETTKGSSVDYPNNNIVKAENKTLRAEDKISGNETSTQKQRTAISKTGTNEKSERITSQKLTKDDGVLAKDDNVNDAGSSKPASTVVVVNDDEKKKEALLSSKEAITKDAANDASADKNQGKNALENTTEKTEPTISDNPASGANTIAANTDSLSNTEGKKSKPVLVKKTSSNKKGFFLFAGIAPEKSYIQGGDVGPLTWAYGGGIGYNISKRWSATAGIISSQKNYVAGPTDYKAKPGSYYYNLKLYHVDAKCRILEIPLTINYNILQGKRHTISAGVGFSSLIMKKEWYDYHFDSLNGNYGHHDWTYRTNKLHPFAAAQLSAGYQFKVNDKFSLMASPYIQIPLYGIGEGSVKLGSAGVMIGGVYRLPSLKKKSR